MKLSSWSFANICKGREQENHEVRLDNIQETSLHETNCLHRGISRKYNENVEDIE